MRDQREALVSVAAFSGWFTTGPCERVLKGGINVFKNPTERSAVSTQESSSSDRAKLHHISTAINENCGFPRVFNGPNNFSCGKP